MPKITKSTKQTSARFDFMYSSILVRILFLNYSCFSVKATLLKTMNGTFYYLIASYITCRISDKNII